MNNRRKAQARQARDFLFPSALMNPGFTHQWRTLLVLGRVSNLPTVWSNCLAGWWLSGGGNLWKLMLLLAGVSALFTGGMFLNDAFDAQYDRQHRMARPIPAGRIPLELVWRFGWGWLALGVCCLLFLGMVPAALAVALAGSIIIFNATHKLVMVSPWLLGLCRFWVYVIAGTTGANGLEGWPVWCGAALALYVVGLNYVARRENRRGVAPYRALLLLLAPPGLALLMDQGAAQPPALFVSLILVLWTARSVRTIFQGGETNAGRIAAGLLAGIVFVDWLAIAPECPQGMSGTLLILFGATILLQRLAPAA